MQDSKMQQTNPGTPSTQLEIANITVGTSHGTSTFYSRSRSSIHQHAMKVSLRRADERARSNEPGLSHLPAEPQSRADLMSRFRAKPSAPRKRATTAKPRTKKTEQEQEGRSLSDEAESVTSTDSTELPMVLRNVRNPTEFFPFDTGLDAAYLNRLLDRSLFGQVPYIVNPEKSSLQYALHDYALLNGMLALACLGRDLDQEMKASRLCLKLKGQTIQAVRQRLSEDPSNITVGTIGAIASLAAFDLLECLGRNEPRPDNMTFLHLAVSQKGGLNGLVKEVVSSCGQCSLLKRIILWLDLSFAIMDETPTHFSFHNTPIHLASTALHTVSLHMTPLKTVFAELSQLSRSVDNGNSYESDSHDQKWLGDQVSGLEQYVTGLSTSEIASDVLEILRLATFLYSGRYIRRYSSNSRIQMQLAIRLQMSLQRHFQRNVDVDQVELGSQHRTPYQNPAYESIMLWSATVAAAASCSFKEISGLDHKERRSFWMGMLIDILQGFEINTITEVEAVLDSLTHDTDACRRDRKLLLTACGIPES